MRRPSRVESILCESSGSARASGMPRKGNVVVRCQVFGIHEIPMAQRVLTRAEEASSATQSVYMLTSHTSLCGDAPIGLRPSTNPVRRARLASHVLCDRDGALADERDGH